MLVRRAFKTQLDPTAALNLRAVAAESAETLNCARRAETEEAGAALRLHVGEAL